MGLEFLIRSARRQLPPGPGSQVGHHHRCGEKAHPADVEDVIQQLDDVVEGAVFGERHSVMSRIVCARVVLRPQASAVEAERRIRNYRQHLACYKVPVKIAISDCPQHTVRHKKSRRAGTGA